jgi:hypothetical protein
MNAWKFLVVLIGIWLLAVGLGHCETQQEQVHTFARAIARTEGFFVRGTIPNRLHNPGDIMTSLPHAYPGQVGIYKHYAVFKSDAWGWAALERQIQRVIDGSSTKYSQDMTMVQIAKVYAENWSYWGKTVCKILKISPQLTFQEYFGLAPRVRFTYDIPNVWMQRGGDAMLPMLSMPEMHAQIYRETGWLMVETMPEWATGEIE